jgi:RND family efflux transporter MFP subunit
MNKKILIPAAIFALAALGWGGKTFMAKRSAPAEQAAAKPAMAEQKPAKLELLASDLITVTTQSLNKTLPITGAVRAQNVSQLKAKVPGDLVQLLVREGETVKKGQIVARIDATDYQTRATQARNSYLAAKGQIDIAQRSYDNNKALVDQNFISKTALDTSLSQLEVAKANAAAAKAALDLADKAITDTAIVSPISGVVSQRFAQQGEKLGQDGRVVEVVDLSALELEAAVPAQDVTQVKVGQAASVVPDGMTQAVQGAVARIAPATQGVSRNVMVYIKLAPQAGAPLKQGMFAQGLLKIGNAADQLAVPVNAVRVDEPQPYVWLLSGGAEGANKLVKRVVTLGARTQTDTDTLISISSGLANNERILRGGISSIADNTLVSIASVTTSNAAQSATAK